MKLILASNNKNKVKEFRQLTQGLDIELVSQSEAGFELDVEETGSSFEENAFLKAEAVTRLSGCAAVADDSGLEVYALGGEPGIYSARYGPGHDASDSDRYNYLLKKLENVEDRRARFVCCICCTMPNGDIIRSRGEQEGKILLAPQGEGGFGYDPVFRGLTQNGTNAQLSAAEKNAISHRGKAMREFIKELERYLNGNKQ